MPLWKVKEETSSSEVVLWQAYFAKDHTGVHREDWHYARLLWMISNLFAEKVQGTPEDWLLKFELKPGKKGQKKSKAELRQEKSNEMKDAVRLARQGIAKRLKKEVGRVVNQEKGFQKKPYRPPGGPPKRREKKEDGEK